MFLFRTKSGYCTI